MFCHHLQTPNTRTTKTCSSKEIFWGSPSFLINVMAPEQAAISLDSNSHAFKATRPAPLSAAISKEALQVRGSDILPDEFQQTHQKEKIAFLHFGILRKRIRLWGEMQLTSIPDRSA